MQKEFQEVSSSEMAFILCSLFCANGMLPDPKNLQTLKTATLFKAIALCPRGQLGTFDLHSLHSQGMDDIDVADSPRVSIYTWREHGEANLLALACTNGFILLRYGSSGRSPVVKQIAWPSDHPIVSMCLDPTVAWLIVAAENGSLFILPALAMLDKTAQVNQLWKLDDVTIITACKPRGVPTTVIWWHTLDDQQIAIMATKLGEIFFIDLMKKKLVAESAVDAHVKRIELVQDDQQMSTHLLITGNSGIQWKLLLEMRMMEILPPTDTELAALGYDEIDGRHLPISSIFMASGPNSSNFIPLRFYQFQRSVWLSPQYAKGRHFVAAHCDKTSTYQIYDSNVEHSPLFVYKLPHGSVSIVFTDRVIFTSSVLGGENKLIVISNQRAEMSAETEKDFNKDAVVQQFDFPKEEKLLTIIKKSFPFYWHEKQEELKRAKLKVDSASADPNKVISALHIQLNSHTVMDGCIIITDTCVYECRPRISPERLFLEFCVHQSDTSVAEQLGVSLSLDLNSLLEVAAEYILSRGNSTRAGRLFQMAKCNPVKRSKYFAKYGFISEVLSYTRHVVMKDNAELTPTERNQLSDLLILCYVYQIKQNTQEKTTLEENFREFLFNNFDFKDIEAIRLLAESGFEEILLDFAMSKGLVIDALDCLAEIGQYRLSQHALEMLLSKGFNSHLARAAGGSFLQCLDAESLVHVLCEKPQLAVQKFDLLLSNLNDLCIESLIQLAAVFDPSKLQMRGYLTRKLHSRRNTSQGSVNSITTEGGDTGVLEEKVVDAAAVLNCFLMTLLTLNYKRKLLGEMADDNYLFEDPAKYRQTQTYSPSPKTPQKLPCHPSPIGCGQYHAALVINGDLFIWGKTSQGRLGRGEQKIEDTVGPPGRVDTLHTLQVKVISVSCGAEHTMVLTVQGVYGWGSSKYGQIGLGTRHTYTRPMLVEGISKESFVSIECGQFHTLALTENADVYSWGWGVYGQLGHGDPEDGLVPRKIIALKGQKVEMLAAGYCHSLVKTSQGYLLAFGCGYFGQLGLGTNVKHTLPVHVNTLKEKVVFVATKFFHSVVATEFNRVYQWGSHPHALRTTARVVHRGQSGGGSLTTQVDNYLNPQLVETAYVNGKIKQIVCGSLHTCLVTTEGDVYAWGKNLEGQIGNGTRQDVRSPSMVTQINDRQIKYLASGGEYNIAMDTENLVWAWGRNDMGQLGINKTGTSVQKSRFIRANQGKRPSPEMPEVIVPTVVRDIPSSAPRSVYFQDPMSLSESFDGSDMNHENEGPHIWDMPDLSSLGNEKYGRTVIPVILQYLPGVCNAHQLIRKCLDMEDWCSAASVNSHLKNYSQALTFHLRALAEQKGNTDEFSGQSVKVLKHYYRLALEKKTSDAFREEELRQMLKQVLQHWSEHHLSTSGLEAFLDTTLDTTAGLLGLHLFRSIECGESDASDGISKDLLDSFSTKFFLRVLKTFLHSIQNNFEKSNPFVFSKIKQYVRGNILDSLPKDIFAGDKLPFDQLWQDIIQNLSKNSESRKYIFVKKSEIDHLNEQLQDQDQAVPSSGDTQRTDAVLFTCGHYFTKVGFVSELTKFKKELTSAPVKMPGTSSLLTEYYSRKGPLPLACPKCVLNSVPEIS
ncbi:hypothetical protein CHS0354_038491 [Potamilus streckersoni]|uniref:Uncharacterized protein n=1 Tax=Potamilus streckersoni TaxID=2493646 RepID=A0AAE0S688_9BIVA|nr:hypothetical protein CHS0354_038491 [Potamilus streckersoni]